MRSSTWDAGKLENILEQTGSYAKTAERYGVSRQRIEVVAKQLLGPDRCKELVQRTHHRYERCIECGDPFTDEYPHAGRGLCVACHRRQTYRARKAKLAVQDARTKQTEWKALAHSLGVPE